MAKLPKAVLDQLDRAEWKLFDAEFWAKDGYLLSISKLRNHNFAVEIRKMSVVNVKLMTVDELDRFIKAPSITYKP